MVPSFGCSCVDGLGAAESPSRWRSCKVQEKMGEGGIDDRGIVMEVDEVWNVFLQRFSLVLVAGNIYVVHGAFLFGMVI